MHQTGVEHIKGYTRIKCGGASLALHPRTAVRALDETAHASLLQAGARTGNLAGQAQAAGGTQAQVRRMSVPGQGDSREQSERCEPMAFEHAEF
ncbi:hypothetical protein GCM10010844_06800 [Deinococcus radiotolerans]|uniref:Uncharacterized protein n=1 Tax=Deinococcus radiotolerans TaxID=1309407 RepID=A0ABQ2FG23_9DEIO|nr:hypothetical protein GCM10010844_06800 [Deinococcus radiotolerans]